MRATGSNPCALTGGKDMAETTSGKSVKAGTNMTKVSRDARPASNGQIRNKISNEKKQGRSECNCELSRVVKNACYQVGYEDGLRTAKKQLEALIEYYKNQAVVLGSSSGFPSGPSAKCERAIREHKWGKLRLHDGSFLTLMKRNEINNVVRRRRRKHC